MTNQAFICDAVRTPFYRSAANAVVQVGHAALPLDDPDALQLGVRSTPTGFPEPGAPAAMREDLYGVLRDSRTADPLNGTRGWPPRYAARRLAWHVLDHAWEIEDKSD